MSKRYASTQGVKVSASKYGTVSRPHVEIESESNEIVVVTVFFLLSAAALSSGAWVPFLPQSAPGREFAIAFYERAYTLSR